MLVQDLIKKLNTLPKDMEVLFDATSPDAEMFKLVSVDDADEVEDSEGNKYVLLSCGIINDEPSLN